MIAVLVWVMVGLALWHFTIFVPDRFLGGIAGACLGAVLGAILIGWLLNGLSLPTREETDLVTAFIGIPGALIGIAAFWLIGARTQTVDD